MTSLDNPLLVPAVNGVIVVRSIEGKDIEDVKTAFDTFRSALEFPDYFGENVNAFRDCVADLSWMHADVVWIVIQNADLIPVAEPSARIDWLPRALGDAIESLNGEPDPDFRVELRVVLVCRPEAAGRVRALWGQLGLVV
ncbi:barstar family protein [Gordonia sp. DT30]|uniref:barstar family protein n=1 Tax=Gordonia sp. DT30 TaxID=3416546 RepID=UPI003CE9136C